MRFLLNESQQNARAAGAPGETRFQPVFPAHVPNAALTAPSTASASPPAEPLTTTGVPSYHARPLPPLDAVLDPTSAASSGATDA